MVMLVILYGASGSGKDYLARALVDELSPKALQVKRPTTRPQRTDLNDTFNYRFMTNEEFAAGVASGDIVIPSTFKENWQYGVFKGISVAGRDPGMVRVITLDAPAVIRLQEYLKDAENVKMFLVEMYPPDMEQLRKRLVDRGDDPLEINRRILADHEDFVKAKKLLKPDFYYVPTNTHKLQQAQFDILVEAIKLKLEE